MTNEKIDMCPCGSGKKYADCCEPVITGKTKAATAEAPEADMGNMEGDVINGDTGMMVDGTGMSEEPFSIVQSPAAMGGITAGIIALGILAGIVLAKLKIKKGISLYED